MQARGPSVGSIAALGVVTLAVLSAIIAGIAVGVTQRGQLDLLPGVPPPPPPAPVCGQFSSLASDVRIDCAPAEAAGLCDAQNRCVTAVVTALPDRAKDGDEPQPVVCDDAATLEFCAEAGENSDCECFPLLCQRESTQGLAIFTCDPLFGDVVAPPPPPPPPAVLECGRFDNINLGDQLETLACALRETEGSCTATGRCEAAILADGSALNAFEPADVQCLDEENQACTDAVPGTDCTCTATVCTRENIQGEFIFECIVNEQPPPPPPPPALRCGAFSDVVLADQPQTTECDTQRTSGVCSAAAAQCLPTGGIRGDGTQSTALIEPRNVCGDAGTEQCVNSAFEGSCDCDAFPVCQRTFDGADVLFECVRDVGTVIIVDDLEIVLVDELRALETELESRGAALESFATRASAPRLAWRAFARNQAAAAGATVELRQADFDSGTLRVLAPCTLVLAEDIEFRPNADADFRPTDAQRGSGEYPRASGFELDFFAAIMIGTDDVLLDLNGHELRASREWHTKQSFGMLISIATTPFISDEGPAAFGDRHYAPNRVVIRNGRLGFNPHHAIHGNAGRGIYLHDLEIELFHIAGIALNGVEDVVIERVTIANTNTELAVTGAFSQARFLQRFLARAAPLHEPSAAALARLARLEKEAFDDVVAANRIDAAAHPDAHRLFDNAARMVDGNAYGLVITNRGTGAPQFDAEYAADGASYRVLVRDVAISNIRNSVVETVALLDERDEPIVGPAGDVLMFDKSLRAGAVDELLDAQLAFAAAFRQFGSPTWHAGTLNVPDALVDWYEAGADVGELGALIAANDWRWARNTE